MPQPSVVSLEVVGVAGPARTPFCFPRDAPLWALAEPTLGRVLRFGTLNRLYQVIEGRRVRDDDRRPFADRALDALGVAVSVPGEQLERVPREGPLVVVANHPFGGVEGLALLSLLQRVRPDVKLLANAMLRVVPELAEVVVPIDVFAEQGGANAAGVRGAARHLEAGGCLGVFPAGEVSHLDWRRRCVTDASWRDTAARLVRRSGATAVCVFFDGRNSAWFQLAGLVHPRLRTALLPTELLRHRGEPLAARVSSPVLPGRSGQFGDAAALTAYLRTRTYLLREARGVAAEAGGSSRGLLSAKLPAEARHERIASPMDPATIAAELGRLPAARRLLSSGVYDVFVAKADELPTTLPEVGRLREWCFREVGEGTGRALDLDRFDEHYWHLVLWNRSAARIAGAYRIGAVDVLLDRLGLSGLYTATLFRYRRKLFDTLGPTLELGRSFVHPLEQRGYQPLQLLWRGIGRFVVLHPRYRYLLGPVSISARYSPVSKWLLHRCMECESAATGGPRPRPKNPPRHRPPHGLDLRALTALANDYDALSRLVSELEDDGKPMPVLLRQYLKLNARVLGFNVDPDFGDVLDALLLVDLAQAPSHMLSRYLGPGAGERLRPASGNLGAAVTA